jgi:hypothetical protein
MALRSAANPLNLPRLTKTWQVLKPVILSKPLSYLDGRIAPAVAG